MHKDNLGCTLLTFRDIVLVLALVSVFLSLFFARALSAQGSVSYFEVTTSSGMRYIFRSDSEKTARITSGGYKYHISFANRSAKITSATCPDKLCARSGEISMPGERIICIPGKLVITAAGETDLDAINR